LSIEEITRSIGVEACRAYERGDFFIGRQRIDGRIVEIERQRPRGVWQVSTGAYLKSDRIVEHAESLLKLLEPKADTIAKLTESRLLFSRISICHVGGGDFTMPSELMKRLASLCDELSITCWEVDEPETEIEVNETAGE
jgi:hypothetical protein